MGYLMPALFELERYVVERIYVESDSEFALDDASSLLGVDFRFDHKPVDAGHVRGSLEIAVYPVEATRAPFRRMELRVSGVATIETSDDVEPDVSASIAVVLAANLYSTSRGVITLVTGAMPYGPYPLPTMNIHEALAGSAVSATNEELPAVEKPTKRRTTRKRSTPTAKRSQTTT